MPELVLIPPAQWEIREPGSIGLVGHQHITIRLGVGQSLCSYTVFYRSDPISRHAVLAEAKAHAMTLPALLLDFGMEP